MNYVIAKDGDRLDIIAYLHYGNTSYLNIILKANLHLIDNILLSGGDKVYLPKITLLKTQTSTKLNKNNLW